VSSFLLLATTGAVNHAGGHTEIGHAAAAQPSGFTLTAAR
jgi:hypothetical protein